MGGKPGLSGSINFPQPIVEVKGDGVLGMNGVSGIHGTQYQGVHQKEETSSLVQEITEGGGTAVKIVTPCAALAGGALAGVVTITAGPLAVVAGMLAGTAAGAGGGAIAGAVASLPFLLAKKGIQFISAHHNTGWVEPIKEVPFNKAENVLIIDEVGPSQPNSPIDQDLKRQAYKAYYEKYSHNVFAIPFASSSKSAVNTESLPPSRGLPELPIREEKPYFPPPPTDKVNIYFSGVEEIKYPDLPPPQTGLFPTLPIREKYAILEHPLSQAVNSLPSPIIKGVGRPSSDDLQIGKIRLKTAQAQSKPTQGLKQNPVIMHMLNPFSGREKHDSYFPINSEDDKAWSSSHNDKDELELEIKLNTTEVFAVHDTKIKTSSDPEESESKPYSSLGGDGSAIRDLHDYLIEKIRPHIASSESQGEESWSSYHNGKDDSQGDDSGESK